MKQATIRTNEMGWSFGPRNVNLHALEGIVVISMALFLLPSFSVFAADSAAGPAAPAPTAANAPADAVPAGGPIVTLNECVQQALAQGPGMRLSTAAVSLAQAQYQSAAAGNALGLNGNASADHTEPSISSRLSGGLVAVPDDSFQAGLSLSAPFKTTVGLTASHTIVESSPLNQFSSVDLSASSTLWDGYPGGSTLAAVRQAALSLQVTQSSEDANRKNIVYQVKQAYYTLLGQQRQLAILQQTLTQRKGELEKTQALFDAQSASQIDLKQAQINQKQAALDLSSAQGNIEVAREQLSTLVGWPIDRLYSVAEEADLPAPSLDVTDAIKTALAQRADLKQLQLKLGSNEIDIALAKSQSSPQVKASGGVTFTQQWNANTNNLGWNAGLQVSMPVVDPGTIGAALRQVSLQRDTLTVQQEQLIASISTNVKNAVYSLRNLRAQEDLAQASLSLAQDQYDLVSLQFDSGVSSNLDVLTASVALTTAQVNRAKARSDTQLGVLALQNAVGN